MKKIIKNLALFCSLPLLLTACGGENSEENQKEDIPMIIETALDAPSEEVVLTKHQFASSGMSFEKITVQNFAAYIPTTGYIDLPPESQASVSPYFGGYVKSVNLLPGQHIRKGQALFSLENPDFIQMQQDYLEAKEQLTYLEADYERQKTLATENIVAQKNYLKAEAEFRVTKARYQGLREKLIMLGIDLPKLDKGQFVSTVHLHAPISGFITHVNIVQGMFVSPNEVAVEIADPSHMHVELEVFEKDVMKLRKGLPITFRIPGANSAYYDAEVHLVGKMVETEKRVIYIHGHFKDESQANQFVPGMYVEAQIFVENQPVKCLPAEAVVSLEGKSFVLLKTKTGEHDFTLARKEVSVGQSNNDWVEILNAVDFAETDEFVTKGAFNLILE